MPVDRRGTLVALCSGAVGLHVIWGVNLDFDRTELELELIQSHMAQKPVLRGEVGCACVAREVSVERGQIIEIEPLIAMNSKNFVY